VRRKPTLSPSKITTYLACPIKYRWTYVDARGAWYVRAKSTYSFGLTLHKVLELFHDSQRTGVETTDQVMAAYEENWVSAGFANAEEMAEVYGEGKTILRRHVEEATHDLVSAKTLFVEMQFRRDLGPFVLVGRPDRIDEHEDGTLEIIDYKTGHEEVTPEDVASSIAMGCYQVLLASAFPDRPLRATILSLRSGKSASYSMSNAEREEFEQDIRFIGSQMLNHDYEYLTPVWKRICQGCDFLRLCRKHEDFEELASP
jgi:putative RecB family exonuclease